MGTKIRITDVQNTKLQAPNRKKNMNLNMNLAADRLACNKLVYSITLKDKEVNIAILKVKPFTNRFTG